MLAEINKMYTMSGERSKTMNKEEHFYLFLGHTNYTEGVCVSSVLIQLIHFLCFIYRELVDLSD